MKSLYTRENAGYMYIYIFTHIWAIQPTAIRHLANQVGSVKHEFDPLPMLNLEEVHFRKLTAPTYLPGSRPTKETIVFQLSIFGSYSSGRVIMIFTFRM